MIATATGRVITVSGQTQSYTVRSGDAVDELARRFDTTRRVIAEMNDLESPYRLRPGQRLRVPAPDRKAYVVVAGDTLFQVSRRFSISVNALRAANGLGANAQIRSGQRLTLPANYRDLGPQRRAAMPSEMVAAATPRRPPTVTRPEGAPPARDYTPAPQQYASAPPPPRPMPSASPPSPSFAAQPPSRPPPAIANPPPPRPVGPPPQTNLSRPNVAGQPPSVPNAPPVADAQIASLGRGRFIWPVAGNVLSTYGPKPGGRRNDGIDISGLDGSTVRAAAAGEIVYAGDQVPGFGNLVLIKHADGWVTAYAHLGRVSVQMRQMVQQGQEIGSVGTTGGVTEPQLHFEVRYAPTPADRARPVDPALVLPQGR
jgi:murein DD-endopeptidase MepM/ murein hydrolase activator NlpD